MKYCSNCGEPNPDHARFCAKCGCEIQSGVSGTTPSPASASSQYTLTPDDVMPNTYLWQSIVVTILCCLPLGIPAIVYAAQVERYYTQGNVDAAQRASNNAKNFCIAALASGLAIYVAYIIYIIAIGGIIAGFAGLSSI
ncbi:MAG: CD225/dispanin family protein [Prevotellaceae bacterium]|jgi:hypothetical protein|nr:CD225/dispanin family protein [Prevotellaceae bacterium]